MTIAAALIGAFLLVAWLSSKPTGRRFLSGQHLDGRRRSDCTFLHKGRSSLDISGHVSGWAKLAGWERLAWRLAAVVFPVAFAAGWSINPAVTVAFAATVSLASLVSPTMRGTRVVRHARHTLRVTKPLADALALHVSQDKGVRARHWIDCPPDYRQAGVTITLPPKFQGTEEQQAKAHVIAAGKLGGEWEPVFNMQGDTPTMTLTHSPEPVGFAGWDILEPHLHAATESRPVLGLGSRGAPITLDFAGETPHILISAPSGGGKTAAARILAVHVLHHGGQVLILDYKKISHQWADGVPGVTYARTAQEIHDALLALQAEIAARYDAAATVDVMAVGAQAGAENGQLSGLQPGQPRRLLVLVEELNQTADILQAHWQQNKPRGVNLHRSPAVMALQGVLYTGRQANVNALVMAQKGTANAFGGTHGAAARENTTPIIGGNSSQNTWLMLAPDATPPPRSTHPGRMHAVINDTVRTVQVGYLTDQQAQTWAISGITAPAEPEEIDELESLGFGTL